MLLCLAALASGAAPLASDSQAPELTLVGPSYRRTSPVITEALAGPLAARDWAEVLKQLDAQDVHLDPPSRQEKAFLEAWALVRLDRAGEASALLPRMDGILTVPRPYVDLVLGEVALANDEPLPALEALSRVPADSPVFPRAAVQRAETLRELNRTREATEVFESMASRADPADGNALALLALAQLKGPGSPEAYPYLRRIWTHYPTAPEGTRASQLLARYTGAQFRATSQERSIRAERWMVARNYGKAVTVTSGVEVGDQQSEAACRTLYVRGRSHYKRNQLTNAIAAFRDAGTRCVGVDGAYGPRSLYLVGTAQFRKKQYAASAETFLKIPELYPEHSMADDGFTHAGISLQEGGDLPAARDAWLQALERFPDGDTAAEATWRLAWSLYLDGETGEARTIAARLAGLDPSIDAVHVDAGRYWHARWAAYPDVADPDALAEQGRAEAVAGLVRLLEERPFSFYSILGAARLAELDPDALEKLQVRPEERPPLERPWEVRRELFEHEGIQNGAALARIGLALEARGEWGRFEGELLPDEKAWLVEMRSLAGDWLFAHEDFRRWIRSHPVGSLGDGERAVIRVAYPDRYWAEVQQAAEPYDSYEPRLFHALVREESNFNRRIVSFAGARGLSQLMPATATQTAGRMGRSVTMTQLFEPQANLDIGGRYLDIVVRQLDGSPYAALAGYNAGPGRVNQWRGAWDNPPTDEFVERIPFRETRGYVKRVMGTWQTYRWFVDDGVPFPDLSHFNHIVQPDH